MKTLINLAACAHTPCPLDGANGALSLCVNMLPRGGALIPMPPLCPDPAASPCAQATSADHFPDAANALQLCFGLQKAGSISIDQKFQVPAYLSAGNSQPGASAPHPSAAADVADCQAAAKQIYAALQHAIAAQAYAKGMIIHPCLLRYALRMSDGSLLWASAPVLLLPNILPPRLAISSIENSDDGQHSIVGFSPNLNPYFQLRCRVVQALDPVMAQRIAGVDIYCTPGIPAYDSDNISTLGITDYGNIVEESNSGGGHRGRADSEVIAGHWSEGNDQYTTHTLAELGHVGTAWHLNPNASLAMALACEDRYHKIASIPVQQLMADNGYFDIPLQSTDPAAIAKLPTLGQLSAGLRHMPAIKLKMAGYTYLAGGRASLEQPQPMQALASARIHVDGGQNCIVAAFIRTAYGTRCAVRSVADMPIADLAGDFPRYLYYPHRGAYKLAICWGGKWRELPLAPHPTLDGAYWMGALDDTAAPAPLSDAEGAALAAEIASASADIATPNTLLCTQADVPWRIVGSDTVGDGGIVALMPAMKAMSQGQFGEHPLYAFCGNGVWAVSAGAKSCQQLNSDVAQSAQAIVAAGADVAYATARDVMLLSGSATACISGQMTGGEGFDSSRLPFWHLIAFKAGLPIAPLSSLPSLLANCRLDYDSDQQVLIVSAPDSEVAYVYNPAEKAWTIRVADCCGAIATHPIALDKHHEPCCIAQARIIGDYMPGSASLLLYGSDNLWDWRLMANSDSGEAADMQGEGVRYAIAVALSRGARLKCLTLSD